jgi:hypothetical protein
MRVTTLAIPMVAVIVLGIGCSEDSPNTAGSGNSTLEPLAPLGSAGDLDRQPTGPHSDDSANRAGSGDSSRQPLAPLGSAGGDDWLTAAGTKVSFGPYEFVRPPGFESRGIKNVPEGANRMWTGSGPAERMIGVTYVPLGPDPTKDKLNLGAKLSRALAAFKSKCGSNAYGAGDELYRVNGLDGYRGTFRGWPTGTPFGTHLHAVGYALADDENVILLVAAACDPGAARAVQRLEESLLTFQRPGYEPPNVASPPPPPPKPSPPPKAYGRDTEEYRRSMEEHRRLEEARRKFGPDSEEFRRIMEEQSGIDSKEVRRRKEESRRRLEENRRREEEMRQGAEEMRQRAEEEIRRHSEQFDQDFDEFRRRREERRREFP